MFGIDKYENKKRCINNTISRCPKDIKLLSGSNRNLEWKSGNYKIKMAVAKIADLKGKLRIMKNKRQLKGTKISSSSKIIKGKAEEERKRGNNVKVGFNKIWINGKNGSGTRKKTILKKNDKTQ